MQNATSATFVQPAQYWGFFYFSFTKTCGGVLA
jgi:hypothetical protein